MARRWRCKKERFCRKQNRSAAPCGIAGAGVYKGRYALKKARQPHSCAGVRPSGRPCPRAASTHRECRYAAQPPGSARAARSSGAGIKRRDLRLVINGIFPYFHKRFSRRAKRFPAPYSGRFGRGLLPPGLRKLSPRPTAQTGTGTSHRNNPRRKNGSSFRPPAPRRGKSYCGRRRGALCIE